MTIKKKTKHILYWGCGILLLAIAIFSLTGRHSKVVETIKQQSASLLHKEYIPNQHIDLKSTIAFQKQDSVYTVFRKNFRMHYQTIGTASFSDSSRLILIAEPAPFFEIDSLESICKPYTHETINHTFKIGYDGRITDLMIILGNATSENVDSLVKRISKKLYLSDYKPNAINLLSKQKRAYYASADLDYQISLSDFDSWFFNEEELFIDNKDTSKSLTVDQLFQKKKRGIFFSKAPGLIAWCLQRNGDISNQIKDIRQFALDGDLILGALRDSTTLIVIAREREMPLEMLPPLRVESILLIASISAKELSQSLDINDCMAGKMPNGQDWCPTYLSKELENTELGHLLTITDILLKDWSESGTIAEAFYRYPSPGHYPFDKPLFKKLGISQLVYNWNTANTMYAIDQPAHTIYTLNRTGALPVSYFNSQERSESVGSVYERQASNYFAHCCNTDLARVVQYTALYQLFMDNGIHYKGKLIPSTFPQNKPYLLAKPCLELLDKLKSLSDVQIDKICDTLAQIHFKAYGEKEVREQLRQNEKNYNFTYSEDHQKEIYRSVNQQQKQYMVNEFSSVRTLLNGLSLEKYDKLIRYLSYPRGTLINNQERYNRMLQAQKVNQLLRAIGKNNLPLLGYNLSKVRDYYVANLSNSGSRYLKTPSVIITYNDMLTTGGHNISSKISRVSSTTNYKSQSSGSTSKPTPSTSPTPAKMNTPASSPPPSTANKGTNAVKSGSTTKAPATNSNATSGSSRSRTSVIPSTTRTTRGF